MEKKEREPRGFYVEKGSFFVHAAVTLLVLSIAARLLGTMTLWSDMTALTIQILLPIGCALLFIVFVLLLGRLALWSTILPVLGGAAYFILSVFNKDPGWPMFICIALAFLAAFLYTATLSGMLRSKWLLVLVLALIFAYQIVFRAMPVFGNMAEPVGFFDGMALLSSLGMVFSVFLASLAFRRKKRKMEDMDLPKIKDPVVVPPAETESAAAPAEVPEAAPSAPAESAPAEPQSFVYDAESGASAPEDQPVPIPAQEESGRE